VSAPETDPEPFDWEPPAPEAAGPELGDVDEGEPIPTPEAAPPEPRDLAGEPPGPEVEVRSLAGEELATRAPGSVDVALLFWAALLAAAHVRIVARRRALRT
jgi:hypothetical protein